MTQIFAILICWQGYYGDTRCNVLHATELNRTLEDCKQQLDRVKSEMAKPGNEHLGPQYTLRCAVKTVPTWEPAE